MRWISKPLRGLSTDDGGVDYAGRTVKYFAYGSNMSIARLRQRVPGAVALGCHALKKYDLRFHKSGSDGSGKCDAFYTGDGDDVVFGALFEISPDEKPALDKAEGLGHGYNQKDVTVFAANGFPIKSITYTAARIDECLKPYSWYVNHVLVGARETFLPENYIRSKISTVEFRQDTDEERDSNERAVHS